LGYNLGSSVPGNALMIVNVTSYEATKIARKRTEAFCNERFPDLTTYVRPLSVGPPPDADIGVRIIGRETDRVFELADRVKEKVTNTPGTKNIRDDWGPRTKKILVKINQARAQRAGVTNMDIAISLKAALTGFVTTEFRERDKVIPVVLRSVAAERRDLGKLETINVYAQASGRNVPLKQVADIEVVWEPSKILRRNRLKTVTVQSDVVEGANAIAISQKLEAWLREESKDWGIGYTYELGGEQESANEANQSIMDKLPIAGMIILLLLVGQFNSIRRPIIILTTIPLGLIGVIIGLLIARSVFGFMTLLGIVSLAGIVVNNAIVLLDRIRIEIQEHGLEPQRAIVEAAQRRLRPILLTTATTIGGLIPLWLSGGPMWEPMAIAIIFGLLFSTLLTLGVVPVMYAVLFRVRFKGFVYA
ncbi:efflux RND transporter permease subunit, partial [bacterium]|nr:efflux RND transporter permease subunit [bacterium]